MNGINGEKNTQKASSVSVSTKQYVLYTRYVQTRIVSCAIFDAILRSIAIR